MRGMKEGMVEGVKRAEGKGRGEIERNMDNRARNGTLEKRMK